MPEKEAETVVLALAEIRITVNGCLVDLHGNKGKNFMLNFSGYFLEI